MNTAFAQSCPPACSSIIAVYESKDPQIARLKDILQKNEDYLKNNPTASSSVLVKVRSNILMTRLQMETEQNEKIASEKTMKEKGCQPCLKKAAPGK